MSHITNPFTYRPAASASQVALAANAIAFLAAFIGIAAILTGVWP